MGLIVFMLLVSALLVVFKDNIKGYALDEVNKHLNKRVHIGYIDIGIWGTFPDMALDFDHVLIHSKFGTVQTADTAFYAEKLRLRFNPFDFLKGSYSVNKIDIENGLLNLEVKQDGSVNYDFIKEVESEEPSNFSFILEKIRLKGLKFSYKNEATEQYYGGFTDYTELSGNFTHEEFMLKADLGIDIHRISNKSLTLMSDKRATCSIHIHMDQINNVFEIEKADVSINTLPFFVRGKVTSDSIDFFLKGDQLKLQDVVKNFSVQQLNVVEQMNGTGNFDIEVSIVGGLEATSSPAIDARFHVDHGSIQDKEFQLDDIVLDGVYSNGVATGLEQLNITNIQFKTLGNVFKGNVFVTDFARPRLKGKADGNLDLKAVHRIFGPFGLQKLAGSVALNGHFDLRMNDPVYQPLNLTIYDLRSNFQMNQVIAQLTGDTRVFTIPSGEVVIRNQQAGFKQLFVQLNQSDILINGTFDNVANYFKKEGLLKVEATVESKKLYLDELSVASSEPSKHAWLLPDDIRGTMTLGLATVFYGGHTYSEVKTRLRFDKKALHFPAMTAKNAGADIKGSLSITESLPMLLHVETKLTSSNVYFDRLFKEWNNFEQETIRSENIKGVAQIDLSFSGPFNLYTGEDLKKQFVADVHIRINNGALVNVSTFKEITESLKSSAVKLVISKEKIGKFEQELMNLKFQSFENRISIKNGVLTIPRMEIKSNALDINVSGIHSFDNEVDYSFDFRFRELKGKGKQTEFGDVVDDGSGFRVYLRMYGDLFNPQFMWDRDAMKLDKQMQREEAKEDFKRVLKQGFGVHKNDTTLKTLGQNKQLRESIEMDFGKDSDSLSVDFDPDKKEKKKTRFGKLIDQWSEENKKEQEKFDLDGD